MTPGSFTSEDKRKVYDFVQFVTRNMRFSTEWNTAMGLEYIRLLGWMQRELMEKIEANTLEVLQVTEAPKPRGKK